MKKNAPIEIVIVNLWKVTKKFLKINDIGKIIKIKQK